MYSQYYTKNQSKPRTEHGNSHSIFVKTSKEGPEHRSRRNQKYYTESAVTAVLPPLNQLNNRNMGNSHKILREASPMRRRSSPSIVSSNSESQQAKLNNYSEYRSGFSSEPKFAGKSSHDNTAKSSNGNLRRNSSDSGYNSSGKACETRHESDLSNGLQLHSVNNNKSCSKNEHSKLTEGNSYRTGSTISPSRTPEYYKHTTGIETRESVLSGRSSSRTNLDFNTSRSRSYTNDRHSPSPIMSPSEGLVGLQNLGNTCFMNSILQCLSHCSPLRGKIMCGSSLHYNKQSKMKGKLYSAFAELIKTMWSKSRTGTSISPHSFKTQIQRFSPRFVGYEQQDSQEFLRFLLEGLNEDLNQAVNTSRRSSTSQVSSELSKKKGRALADEMWEQYKLRDDSLVTDLFCGQIISTLTCTKCSYESETFDPFWDLSLSIPQRRPSSYSDFTVSLMGCLAHFTKEEVLDGDEKPKCEKCKTRQKCKKEIKIHRFPRILVIHLKRFSGFGFRSKLQTDVKFPLGDLNMSEFASKHSDECSKGSRVKYNLFAVSNHSGSAYGGHYTAYCKHPESKQWNCFNDSRVNALSSGSVRGSQAYVLFYERAET